MLTVEILRFIDSNGSQLSLLVASKPGLPNIAVTVSHSTWKTPFLRMAVSPANIRVFLCHHVVELKVLEWFCPAALVSRGEPLIRCRGWHFRLRGFSRGGVSSSEQHGSWGVCCPDAEFPNCDRGAPSSVFTY